MCCTHSNIYVVLLWNSVVNIALLLISSCVLVWKPRQSTFAFIPGHRMIHWRLLHGHCLSPLERFYVHVTFPRLQFVSAEGTRAWLKHLFILILNLSLFSGGGGALSLFSSWLAHGTSFLLEGDVVLSLDLLFLDGFSGLALSVQQRNLLLAALTAAGRMLVSCWIPPHLVIGCMPTIQQFMNLHKRRLN